MRCARPERDRATGVDYTGCLTSVNRGIATGSTTRIEIVRALRLLRTKRETLPAKKHGNIPL